MQLLLIAGAVVLQIGHTPEAVLIHAQLKPLNWHAYVSATEPIEQVTDVVGALPEQLEGPQLTISQFVVTVAEHNGHEVGVIQPQT